MEHKAKLTGVLKVPCNGTHKNISEAVNALATLGLTDVEIVCKDGFLAGPSGDIVFAQRLKIVGLRHGRSAYFIDSIVDGKPCNIIPASDNVFICVAGFGE